MVNNDPAITGLSFNTARAPYDNVDVRWALLLAIDIAEYMGVAVDGAGALSPVHIPSLGSYPQDFIGRWRNGWPTSSWIWVTVRHSSPTIPMHRDRIVEYAEGRGYVVPEDQAAQDQAFGLGWYKYAPEAAEKLLIKNGFSRDADGMWLLPDGTPWKIECVSGRSSGNRSRVSELCRCRPAVEEIRH